MSHKLAVTAGSLLLVAVATPHVGALFAPAYRQPPVRIVAAPALAMAVPVAPPVVVATAAPVAEPPAVAPETAVYGDPKEPAFDSSQPLPDDAPPA